MFGCARTQPYLTCYVQLPLQQCNNCSGNVSFTATVVLVVVGCLPEVMAAVILLYTNVQVGWAVMVIPFHFLIFSAATLPRFLLPLLLLLSSFGSVIDTCAGFVNVYVSMSVRLCVQLCGRGWDQKFSQKWWEIGACLYWCVYVKMVAYYLVFLF